MVIFIFSVHTWVSQPLLLIGLIETKNNILEFIRSTSISHCLFRLRNKSFNNLDSVAILWLCRKALLCSWGVGLSKLIKFWLEKINLNLASVKVSHILYSFTYFKVLRSPALVTCRALTSEAKSLLKSSFLTFHKCYPLTSLWV